MPLKKGKSKAVLQENIREFHHGKTYARTARKFGKTTANKQAVGRSIQPAPPQREALARETQRHQEDQRPRDDSQHNPKHE